MNERLHPEFELDDQEANRKLGAKTRRGFLAGGIAAAASIGAYRWITGAQKDNDIPWPERRILDVNGALSRSYVSNTHLMPEFPRTRVGGVKPNGNIGLDAALDRKAWAMQVTSDASSQEKRITLADILALPKVEMTTRFCCIEGWSGISHWTGARFSDFTEKLWGTSGTKLPPYVYMATADEAYYVGLDRKSAMHPQTLLAYYQDGKPLEDRRGAPLRLVIPVKYGIKNIKRIGQIKYTDQKPDDYWAEEGYDWFAGL